MVRNTDVIYVVGLEAGKGSEEIKEHFFGLEFVKVRESSLGLDFCKVFLEGRLGMFLED